MQIYHLYGRLVSNFPWNLNISPVCNMRWRIIGITPWRLLTFGQMDLKKVAVKTAISLCIFPTCLQCREENSYSSMNLYTCRSKTLAVSRRQKKSRYRRMSLLVFFIPRLQQNRASGHSAQGYTYKYNNNTRRGCVMYAAPNTVAHTHNSQNSSLPNNCSEACGQTELFAFAPKLLLMCAKCCTAFSHVFKHTQPSYLYSRIKRGS